MSACPEKGEHCWHRSSFQHAVQNHRDEVCCHCGAGECVYLEVEPDPAHGRFHPVMRLVAENRSGS